MTTSTINFGGATSNYFTELEIIPNYIQTSIWFIDTNFIPFARVIQLVLQPTQAFALYYGPNGQLATRATPIVDTTLLGLANPIQIIQIYFIGNTIKIVGLDSGRTYAVLLADFGCGYIQTCSQIGYVTNDIQNIITFASNSTSFQIAFNSSITNSLQAFNFTASQPNYIDGARSGAVQSNLCDQPLSAATITLMALSAAFLLILLIIGLISSAGTREFFFYALN